MIVLDANILIRAVRGRRVRQLLETYADRGLRFCAPDIAYADAMKYLPPLLRAKRMPDTDVPAAIQYLQSLVEPVNHDFYMLFEEGTSLAAASLFGLPIASRFFCEQK
jgi:predicted nucleic acid-binding protein